MASITNIRSPNSNQQLEEDIMEELSVKEQTPSPLPMSTPDPNLGCGKTPAGTEVVRPITPEMENASETHPASVNVTSITNEVTLQQGSPH